MTDTIHPETAQFPEEENLSRNSSDATPSTQNFEKPSALSPAFKAFEVEFQAAATLEEKLQLGLNFMKEALAQSGTPQFKNFWDARKLCLPLFKENLSPIARGDLWNSYTELANEARRLKDILDEQSAFAAEQIDLAIKDIESSFDNYAEQLQASSDFEVAFEAKTLARHAAQYKATQKELNLLNAHSARVNSLRKELIKTEMRIKFKNQFFQRLSKLGDKIFPRRKELIKTISDLFQQDVDGFIAEHFSQDKVKGLLFDLREEIKNLQSIAKTFTLNTSVFTSTRKKLSESWDRVKDLEKEFKKNRAEKKALFKQNIDEIEAKIATLTEELQANPEMDERTFGIKVKEITDSISKSELGGIERKSLFAKIDQLRQQIAERSQKEMARRQEEQDKIRLQKQQEIQALRQKIDDLLKNAQEYDLPKIEAEKEALIKEISQCKNMTKQDKQHLERHLKTLSDILMKKKASSLLALSETDREAFSELESLLQEQIKHRKELKAQLDGNRKASGSFGLDFEKQLAYQAMIEQDKERLAAADVQIRTLEQKISEIRSKA